MATLYRNYVSQAQIDAQYNPSIGLADASAPSRHYAAQAQHARQRLHCVADVPYGPTVHETLDIFPANAPGAPVVVFFHGGYWRAFSSKDFSGVALGLHALGITTVVVNYALCPQVAIDEITRQARAAVAWTLRHIATYGGDPQRVGVCGHSAGAHLGAMCLFTAWDTDYGLPPNPLKAALLLSGLYDLAPLRYSYLQPIIQLDEGIIQRQSPVLQVRGCPTPTWLAWGGAESAEFARQSQALHVAAHGLGNPVECASVEGADHFTVLHGLEDPRSTLCQWLAPQLRA